MSTNQQIEKKQYARKDTFFMENKLHKIKDEEIELQKE